MTLPATSVHRVFGLGAVQHQQLRVTMVPRETLRTVTDKTQTDRYHTYIRHSPTDARKTSSFRMATTKTEYEPDTSRTESGMALTAVLALSIRAVRHGALRLKNTGFVKTASLDTASIHLAITNKITSVLRGFSRRLSPTPAITITTYATRPIPVVRHTLVGNTATAVLNIWATFKSAALPLFDLRPTTIRLLSYTRRTERRPRQSTPPHLSRIANGSPDAVQPFR